MDKYLIYALVDPRYNEIRYIGKSSSGLYRPNQHFTPHSLSHRSHKNAWIKNSKEATGMWPLIRILHIQSNSADLGQKEIELIKQYRDCGCSLTNVTLGGDGFTPESAKIASALQPKEARQKGGLASSKNGHLLTNNLSLRRPVVAVHKKTLEERWYLSPSHAEADGFDRSCIWSCLKGKRWSIGGFWWLRPEEVTPEKIASLAARKKRSGVCRRKPFTGVSLTTGEVINCSSTLDIPASFSPRHVWACLAGERKTHKGFIWTYLKP